MTRRRHMVPREEATLIRMAEQGHTYREIAEAIGKHPSTVSRAAQRWGLRASLYTTRRDPERERRVIDSYLSGTPTGQILAHFGISAGAFYRLMHRHGVPLRKSLGKPRAAGGVHSWKRAMTSKTTHV